MEWLFTLEWTMFSLQHFITIIIAVLIGVILYYFLKKVSDRKRTIVLFVLSLFGWAAIIYNLIYYKSPLTNLPLELCSINAILLPILVLTNNKVLGNIMPVMAVGAFGAIILNFGCDYPIFSWSFFFYYFPHLMEGVIPWLLVFYKKIKPELKHMFSGILIIIVFYTFAHFINVIITNNTEYKTNYMFSMHPSNVILEVVWNMCPHQYWYMFIFSPVLLFLFTIYNIKNIIDKIKNRY